MPKLKTDDNTIDIANSAILVGNAVNKHLTTNTDLFFAVTVTFGTILSHFHANMKASRNSTHKRVSAAIIRRCNGGGILVNAPSVNMHLLR